MIMRQNNYLKNKKKKYLTGSLIWLIIMFTVFFTGIILNKTRNNIFTVVAAVLVLPVAQYATQLFAILKFQDPDDKISKQLGTIKGDYSLFHSAIMPDQKGMINFDHIIVTGEKIYCMVDGERDITNMKEWFSKKIGAKGIPLESIVYIEKSKIASIEKLIKKIEVSAKSSNEDNRNEYTKLINQMMM